ncbi:MAG: BrnA antitoxin family protein [Candidatus Omnitrophica bacterium]|nr:BrnA antitoxin family protein [Candidatus Omnitrophota bacterium]MBI3083193.1 BrnA antitoxin family protein [Candidatus Omnitrophota bacterium]
MRAGYDFSTMKGRRNPYARLLKKPVTIRLGADVVDYFKSMANQLGVPYQNLMNLYLRDCVQSHRHIQWVAH